MAEALGFSHVERPGHNKFFLFVLFFFIVYCSLSSQTFGVQNQAAKNTKLVGCTTRPLSGTLRGKTSIPNTGANENTEIVTTTTRSKIAEISWVDQDGELTTATSNLRT